MEIAADRARRTRANAIGGSLEGLRPALGYQRGYLRIDSERVVVGVAISAAASGWATRVEPGVRD